MFKSVLCTFGTDFVIHNTYCYNYSNNAFCDFVYSTATHNTALWLLEDPNSKLRIRQACSSAYHFNRLLHSILFSSIDYGFSSTLDLFSIITRLSPTFFADRSNLRGFKRVMLTLRRNGGVYEDLFEMLSSFFKTYSIEYNNVLNSRAFYTSDQHLNSRTCPFSEAKKIIEQELSINFDDVFCPINLSDKNPDTKNLYKSDKKCRELFNVNFYKDVTTFDCRLKDSRNVAVTISVIPPHLQRMRSFDLFPLKVVSGILGVIPFMSGYSQCMKSTIKRLEWDIPKEVNARMMILEGFGVNAFKKQNFLKEPKNSKTDEDAKLNQNKVLNTKSVIKLFKQSRNSAGVPIPFISTVSSFVGKIFSTSHNSLPLYVPAPIPPLCSKHVMVTDIENHDEVFQSNPIILQKLSNFTTKLNKKCSCVVPNMAVSNVFTSSDPSKSKKRIDDDDDSDDSDSSDDEDLYASNVVSLKRYGSAVKVQKDDISNLGLLYAGLLINNKNMAMKGVKHFGIDRQIALDALSDNSSSGNSDSFLSFFKKVSKNKNNRFAKIGKALLYKNSDFSLSAGETVMSLTSHVSDTYDMAIRTTKFAQDYIGTLLTDYSLNFN